MKAATWQITIPVTAGTETLRIYVMKGLQLYYKESWSGSKKGDWSPWRRSRHSTVQSDGSLLTRFGEAKYKGLQERDLSDIR